MLQRQTMTPLPTTREWPWSQQTFVEGALGFLRFLALILVLCIACYYYVQPASSIATTRAEISRLQAEYARLQRENAEYARQLADLMDIHRIEARARELGMGPRQHYMYITLDLPTSPTAETIAGPPSNTSRTSWWERFLNQATAMLNPPVYAQAMRRP
ncbi:MAG: hypothetical protein Kow0047_07190 [Anaerolineae bacterium]